MRDMRSKGRDNYLNGQSINTNKLTPAQVQEIRYRKSLGQPYRSMAKRYAVTTGAIVSIIKGRSWKHLPYAPPL